MKRILSSGDHRITFNLNSGGFIDSIVHDWSEHRVMDDCWQKRDRYKGKSPDWLIAQYVANGWQEQGV